jgi:FkbM family methyltransferase
MNKFALVMIFQNDAHWLHEHLPVMASSFDLIIAIDGGSSDGSAEVVKRHGGLVYDRPFDNNFSAQINFAVEKAEEHDATAMLRLDPDECMMPEHITSVRELLREYKAVILPRITFEKDRWHYWPEPFPDFQVRAFQLGHNIRYAGKVHESPMPVMLAKGWLIGHHIMTAPHAVIFHYEGLYSPQYKAWKHINYKRMEKGEPPFDDLVLPNAEHRKHIRYVGQQPVTINPARPRAPFPDFDVMPYTRNGTRIWTRTDTDRAVLAECQDTYMWERLPEQLDRVIDVGAHIGCYCIEVKKRFPKARISAVEVEDENFALLQTHVGHWPDIDIHKARAGYREGEYMMAYNHMSTSSHRVQVGAFEHPHFINRPCNAPLLKLEDLLTTDERINLLKLDVEGSEVEILEGISDDLLQRIDCIIGERHMVMSEFEGANERLKKFFDVEHFPREGFNYLGMFWAKRKDSQ